MITFVDYIYFDVLIICSFISLNIMFMKLFKIEDIINRAVFIIIMFGYSVMFMIIGMVFLSMQLSNYLR